MAPGGRGVGVGAGALLPPRKAPGAPGAPPPVTGALLAGSSVGVAGPSGVFAPSVELDGAGGWPTSDRFGPLPVTPLGVGDEFPPENPEAG